MTKLKIGMIILEGFSQHFKVETSESENRLTASPAASTGLKNLRREGSKLPPPLKADIIG
jgi:hypothetical protein